MIRSELAHSHMGLLFVMMILILPFVFLMKRGAKGPPPYHVATDQITALFHEKYRTYGIYFLILLR